MKKIVLALTLIATAITFNACSNDNSSSGSYAYKVRMTDDPGPFSEVNVDIQAVEVKGSNGQTVLLNTNAGVYNLLDYANGADTLIATSTLTDSRVNQIRLILGPNNTVVVDGQTYPLSTPSAEQSGLKLLINQDLVADIDNSILIDFDANASVIQTGNGTYKLKPVLRTVVAAISGNITGSIAPVGTLASVSATSTNSLVVYTSTVDAEGNFRISGLPPGTYTVIITPLSPLLPVTQTDIVVEAGASTNIGVINF
ncbi:DUF4382 domain-containing protein [Flavobacterium sp. IMCC34852]|uniref:DUF4382 domain-containing protein n=1 Tax=Flavobacterium rivulicola TaxID=2732161 RepID=A0A7Y3R8D8_9FLAO|nr:DUF4382 domain-containing protein [Flavobacterium sp. IMCC34852]NNT71410.1 DUF4382 domain-containing protein [Flavobacterium sp. IMCC34852]